MIDSSDSDFWNLLSSIFQTLLIILFSTYIFIFSIMTSLLLHYFYVFYLSALFSIFRFLYLNPWCVARRTPNWQNFLTLRFVKVECLASFRLDTAQRFALCLGGCSIMRVAFVWWPKSCILHLRVHIPILHFLILLPFIV